MTAPPHAPHRVHDCTEPNMVQGHPSSLRGEGKGVFSFLLSAFSLLLPLWAVE